MIKTGRIHEYRNFQKLWLRHNDLGYTLEAASIKISNIPLKPKIKFSQPRNYIGTFSFKLSRATEFRAAKIVCICL